MGLLRSPLEPSSWFIWALLLVTFTGTFMIRHVLQRKSNNSDTMAPPITAGKRAAASAFAPPCVRLPQGTYIGRKVAVGQNVIEAAGLGLGVGGGGPPPPPPPASSSASDSRRPLPIPRQMALPKALDVFLGIPYAKSTAGVNRFRAPVPLAVDSRGTGDLNGRIIPATQLGQRCPGTAPNPFIPEGEDCLNLNVYRPSPVSQRDGRDREKHVPAGPLPVVVYVHGGGFNNGMGAERDMASFVGYADVDLVGVSFNYRVGALGFLGWQNVNDDDDSHDDEAPLNVGLRDQQALFAWVQSNIRYFSGDPNNITIMGLSAGAHSIGHHLLYYPPGQAPFHKAILESGGPTARAVWNPDHARPKSQLRQFLVAAGAFTAQARAQRTTTGPHERRDILAYLRGLPLPALVAASRQVWNDYQANVCWPFQPVIDGQVIPREPLRTWQSGFSPQIPVMTGFNSNEGTLFVPGDRSRADTDAHFRTFFADLVPGLTSDDLDELARVYPDPVTDPDHSPYVIAEPFPPGVTGRQWARMEAAYAHYAYICPVLQTAHYLSMPSAAGNPKNKTTNNVYLYEFAAHSLGWNTANHGDNQTAVAHSMAVLRGNPGLLAVADAMNGAWARFAASPVGSPNIIGDGGDGSNDGPAGVTWTPFVSPFAPREKRTSAAPAAGALMVFGKGNDERVPPAQRKGGSEAKPGTPAALRSLSDYELAQCRFWWDRGLLSQGDGQPAAAVGGPAKRGVVHSRL